MSHTLQADPLDDDFESKVQLLEPDHGAPAPLVQKPWILYCSILLVLFLAIVFPLSFCIYLALNDGLPAPRSLALIASQEPRSTALVVTTLAAALAGTVHWAFSQAIDVMAKKRFASTSLPISDIEYLSALKNGAILWFSNERKFRKIKTAVVVGLFGLLTPGFAALLSPLPYSVRSAISAGYELTLSNQSTSCVAWYDNLTTTLWSGTNCASWQSYNGLTYNACPAEYMLVDVLNAGKSSLLGYLVDDIAPSASDLPKYVSSLTGLARTRLIGSTGGVLPIGPAGIDVFNTSQMTIPSIVTAISSDAILPAYNYTTLLQGVWANVSCEYIDPAQSEMYADYGKDNTTWVGVECPNGITTGADIVNTVNGLLASAVCFNPNNATFTLHLQSFWSSTELETIWGVPVPVSSTTISSSTSTSTSLQASSTIASRSTPTAPARPRLRKRVPVGASSTSSATEFTGLAYAGIGTMQCSLTPRVRTIVTTFRTDIGAFMMTPADEKTTVNVDVVERLMNWTNNVIFEAQTVYSGNLLAETVNIMGASYYDTNGKNQSAVIPYLFASMIQGVYEYEATHMRLVLAASSASWGPPVPSECHQSINGQLIYNAIGWDLGISTVLSLLPLFAVCCAGITVLLYTVRSGTRLTRFDPTVPASLVAAASAGGLVFGPEAVGDPEDEVVLATSVQYTRVSETGRWGLVQRGL